MRAFSKALYPTVRDDTFFHSCGVGDLIATCYGGRNRMVAEAWTKARKEGRPTTFEQLETVSPPRWPSLQPARAPRYDEAASAIVVARRAVGRRTPPPPNHRAVVRPAAPPPRPHRSCSRARSCRAR